MDLATAAYEAAYNKEPSENLANAVFLSYGREFRFAEQKTVRIIFNLIEIFILYSNEAFSFVLN